MIAERTAELLLLNTPQSCLLRVPVHLSYCNCMSRPLSVHFDIGFTGYTLVSSKVAAELGGGSLTQDLPVCLANGTIVSSIHTLADVMRLVSSKCKGYKETTSVCVFLLHSYDMIHGKEWLDAHDTLITCPANTLTIHAHTTPIVVHGSDTPQLDLACMSADLMDDLGLLTHNQFKKFVEQNDVENSSCFPHA